MNTIEQYDVVALLDDLPEENLQIGSVGAVIEKYNEDAFEVEFSDHITGITYAMVALRAEVQARVRMRRDGEPVGHPQPHGEDPIGRRVPLHDHIPQLAVLAGRVKEDTLAPDDGA